MESEWHRNVATYGLGGLGATVCSPTLAIPQAIVTNELGPEVDDYMLWFVPTFPWEPYFWFRPGKVAGHPHFPYGIEVVPDVHG